jgi:hypothetical protein
VREIWRAGQPDLANCSSTSNPVILDSAYQRYDPSIKSSAGDKISLLQIVGPMPGTSKSFALNPSRKNPPFESVQDIASPKVARARYEREANSLGLRNFIGRY